jgi:uncharacterized membrane protein
VIDYALLKTVHVISSTLLFGTGLGTAFHMWTTHLRGDVRAIAATARNVVLADWLFTATSGVVQLASGAGLVVLAAYDPLSPWLVATYALYVLAGACWLVVVGLQIRVARLAAASAQAESALPAAYHRAMRLWFWLGWPAFLTLLGVFWLMVRKPRAVVMR